MSNLELFDPAESSKSFEEMGFENGEKSWYARDFMMLLGYDNFGSFGKAINRAMIVCNQLGIPIHETIQSITRDLDGKQVQDFKLNRFGCYLTAMNCDVRKPQVAQVQAYFAMLSEALLLYVQENTQVERVAIRGEISDHEKSLAAVASEAGVSEFGLFQNAGYRGMYNMNLNALRIRKGVPSGRSPLDYMDRTELAANLFRVTQTEETIKNRKVYGQKELERTAMNVGKEVRATMEKLSGIKPEDLPTAEDLKDVKKRIKKVGSAMKKLDKKK
jgi:DNA-damage-inducible protein D